MSKGDSHPAIRHGANMDGWSQDADIDPNAFGAYQSYKFILSPARDRMDALNQLDAQISADATPRQRSELISVRRQLSNVHERLLLLGK